MNDPRQSERGQVLVLVVLAIVVLLGFTALAVDGGMVYSDRRHAQSASDASSLGGGGAVALSLENSLVTYLNWNCDSSAVENAESEGRDAAIVRAGNNDYTIDEDIADTHGVTTTCGEEDNGSWVDKYIDVLTMITRDTDTSFAHLVYSGPLRNTVEAVTRVRPRTPMALGNAIVALRRDCPNSSTGGVHVDGTANIAVSGGGIFSNSCLVSGGSVDVDVDSGSIMCTGSDCYTENGHPDVDPPPDSGSVPLPPYSYYVAPPDCSAVPDRGGHSGDGSILPGRYTQIRLNSSSDELEMAPGLYCLSNGLTANGGIIEGHGVTIYITGGDFDVSGGVFITLTAPPNNDCAYCPPAIEGMLIFLAEGNDGEVSLLGTSDSEYLGTVYAPSGTIEAGGTGSELSEIHAQLIADTVKLHGTTTVQITFDGEESNQIPATLELYK